MKKLHEQQVYSGYRGILQRTFELPNGQPVVYDVVLNGDYVTVAAFTPEREAILVKQFRPGAQRILWSFPEGGIDPDEPPARAASRELLEETGYAGRVESLAEVPRSYATQRQHCFIATDCRYRQAPRPDEDEILEVVLLPLDAFRALLRSGTEPFLNRGTAYQALDRLGWL